MNYKLISNSFTLNRRFFNQNSIEVFLNDIVDRKSQQQLTDIQGWYNYKTAQFILGRSTTHSCLKAEQKLSADNIYPFTLYLESGTDDVVLVYGSSNINEIPSYIRSMVDQALEQYLLEPAGLRVRKCLTQCQLTTKHIAYNEG